MLLPDLSYRGKYKLSDIKKITIGIDPGKATGLAVLEEDFIVAGWIVMTPGAKDLALFAAVLGSIIALYYKGKYSIELVIERPPARGEADQMVLFTKMKERIEKLLKSFPNAMLYEALPGHWKPSTKSVDVDNISGSHAKDAAKMAIWHWRKLIK